MSDTTELANAREFVEVAIYEYIDNLEATRREFPEEDEVNYTSDEKHLELTINGKTFVVLVIPDDKFTEQLADMLGPYEGEGL